MTNNDAHMFWVSRTSERLQEETKGVRRRRHSCLEKRVYIAEQTLAGHLVFSRHVL